jgi:predicted metalloprotease with PDZ domain
MDRYWSWMGRLFTALVVCLLLIGSAGDALASSIMQRLGIEVGPIPEAMTQALRLSGRGAYVLKVRPNSPAAKAGIKVYDIIFRVGKRPVDSPADLESAMGKLQQGESFRLMFKRVSGRMVSFTVGEPRQGQPPAHKPPQDDLILD